MRGVHSKHPFHSPKPRTRSTPDLPILQPPKEEIVLANSLCYARYNRYPVSPGHLLIIPYRHIPDFFDAELTALLALLREAKTLLDGRCHPDGCNVGVNVGTAAGRTVMHLHVHVIPHPAGRGRPPAGDGSTIDVPVNLPARDEIGR
ncbi:MAG TPA: HIT domain-containing protein [Methanoculleus sp.]|nr:HIT domain-containing protein [Methanoculleus sp.]